MKKKKAASAAFKIESKINHKNNNQKRSKKVNSLKQ
jgi:hypothetical protein